MSCKVSQIIIPNKKKIKEFRKKQIKSYSKEIFIYTLVAEKNILDRFRNNDNDIFLSEIEFTEESVLTSYSNKQNDSKLLSKYINGVFDECPIVKIYDVNAMGGVNYYVSKYLLLTEKVPDGYYKWDHSMNNIIELNKTLFNLHMLLQEKFEEVNIDEAEDILKLFVYLKDGCFKELDNSTFKEKIRVRT